MRAFRVLSILVIVAMLAGVLPTMAASPARVRPDTIVVDGVIDAEYGAPVATDQAGDGNGNANMDLLSLYVAQDATAYYFAWTINANIVNTNWGKYILYVDTTNDANGATSDAWGRNVVVQDPHKPEFSVNSWSDVANYGTGNIQFWQWNQGTTSWSQNSTIDEAARGAGDTSVLEWKVLKSALGNPNSIWVEVYSTGGGDNDNAQDTINDPAEDWNASNWSDQATLLNSTQFPAPVTDLVVTFPGGYVEAAGLGGNWDPGNLNTQANDANGDQVWKFTTDSIPAGSYEFKATVGGTWDENYGVNGEPGGPNVQFTTAGSETVHFYYDRRDSNMVASRPNYRIPVLVGNLMSAVGGANWSPDNLVGWMKDRDGDGWYTTSFNFPPGSYEYKVALNESWDENYGQNGVPGGPNIQLVVPASANAPTTVVNFRYNDTTHQIQDSINNPPTPQVGDNNIWWDGLGHNSRMDMFRQPFGAVEQNSTVTLRFRTYANDVQRVKARVWNTVLQGQTIYNLRRVATDSTAAPFGYEYWETTFDVGPDLSILYYRFIIEDGTAVAYYEETPARAGGWGQAYSQSPDRGYNIYVYKTGFTTPEWVKNAVIYQIFPDRFRNGDATNDPTAADWFYPAERGHRFPITPWNTIVPDPEPNIPSNPWYLTYSSTAYGGDLQGIIDELDYLQDLGITTVYLNPIFDSPSNHKYDGRDYRRIDPTMGVLNDDAATLALYQTLATELENRGMYLILDAVPNHVSSDSPFFDRFNRHAEVGACESVDSPYRTWFFFQPASPAGTGVCAGDTNYTAWFGVATLPQINTNHPDVLDYWFGPQGAANYWLDLGADGWRVDVVPDVVGVNPTFFETWRQVTKAANPNSMMFSETWGEGDAQFRLLGDEFDSTMNYRFRKNLLGFLRDTAWEDNDNNGDNRIEPLSPSQFEAEMRAIQEDYPEPAFATAMNLVDSHDTNRAVRVLDHFGIANGQPVDDFEDGRDRLALLAIVQMTLPGAPTIYYGDEVGLVGYGSDIPRDDPYNRQPYPWSDEAGYSSLPAWRQAFPDLLSHYETLTSLRNSKSFLRTGTWDTLLTDDANKVLVYGRRDGTGVAVVAINRDTVEHQVVVNVDGYVPEGAMLDDALATGTSLTIDASRTMTFTVAPMWGRVWVSQPGIDMSRPGAPRYLAAAEGDGEVSLTWQPPAELAPLDGYVVYRSLVDGGFEPISDVLGDTEFVDDSVINGNTYYYEVRAVTTTGLPSEPSNTVSALPHYVIGWANLQWPPEITHTVSIITPTVNIYGQVWIDGVTSQAGATPSLMAEVGYGARDSDPATTAGWSWVAMTFNTNAGNNDEFQGNLLPHPVGEYDYAVRYSTSNGRDWLYADLDGTGNGYDPDQAGKLHVVSSGDTTPPSAPQNLRERSRSAATISIEWDASPEPDTHAYGVYREPVATDGTPAAPVMIALVLAPTTEYTDDSVATGMTYRYTVTAIDTSFNESPPSNAVEITAEQRIVSITWNVTTPAFTPPGDTIYIAGDNGSVFGASWNPGFQPLTPNGPNSWSVTLQAPEGTQLQYKFTRGSWDRVEWWGTLVGLANRSLSVVWSASGNQVVDITDLANWRDLLVVQTGYTNQTNAPDVITSLWATMNRPIDPATTAIDTITVVQQGGGAVAGVTVFNPATWTFTFTPTVPLSPGLYTATVNPGNLRGTDNDNTGMLAPYSWDVISTPTAVRVDQFGPMTGSPVLPAILLLALAGLALLGAAATRRRTT